MVALNNNYFDSKSDLLKVISDIIEDKQVVNHRKQETDAESGLDEFEKMVFYILTKNFCVYEDLTSLLMFFTNTSSSGESSGEKSRLIKYSTDGGDVAVHPDLLSLLKFKLEALKIKHQDIKDLEQTFFLYVGMESDDYLDNFCEETQDEYKFKFNRDDFENPIRDIASKALHILAFLSQRLYDGETPVTSQNTDNDLDTNIQCCMPMVKCFLGNQLEKNKLVKVKLLASFRNCIGDIIDWFRSILCMPKKVYPFNLNSNINQNNLNNPNFHEDNARNLFQNDNNNIVKVVGYNDLSNNTRSGSDCYSDISTDSDLDLDAQDVNKSNLNKYNLNKNNLNKNIERSRYVSLDNLLINKKIKKNTCLKDFQDAQDLKRSQSFNSVLSFYQGGGGGDFGKPRVRGRSFSGVGQGF